MPKESDVGIADDNDLEGITMEEAIALSDPDISAAMAIFRAIPDNRKRMALEQLTIELSHPD